MPRSLLLALLLAAPAMGQKTASVEGVVLNRADRQPVRKAAVTLSSMGQDRSYAIAITDGSGRFILPAIPAGRYRLIASRNAFFSIAYGASGPDRAGIPLIVEPGQPRQGIKLYLLPQTGISGTVMDAEGDGVAGVQVGLYVRRMDRGKARFFNVQNLATTDAHGRYRMPGVLPGEYWVMAWARFLPVFRTRPATVMGDPLSPETLATQFYPGTDRIDSASAIPVTAGRDTENIDFHLNYVPQVSLHGTVAGIPSAETKNIQAVLEQEAVPGTRNYELRIPIDPANPAFQMAGIAAGRYRLVVSAGTRRAIVNVQLTAPDTEVNMALPAGVPLAGTVTFEGPRTGSSQETVVTLSPGDYIESPNMAVTAKGGAFRFDEVPSGIWDIGVRPLPKGAYIKSMRLGQQDVLTEDMEIGANTKGPLAIVVSTAAPKVEGTVDPPGPAVILAAPTGKFAPVFSFYGTVMADEKGRFKLEGLNPGSYRLYAFQDVEPEAWQHPAFLPPFEAQSKPVELKEGARETVSLTVIGEARL